MYGNLAIPLQHVDRIEERYFPKIDAVANSRFSFLRNLVTSLWLPNQNANVGQMGADIFA